ncbi:MAG: hypothetical protein ABI810_18620 [Sphingomonas bacterium]
MTIALFLLAAAGQCAVPTLCPSREDLISAVKAHNRDLEWRSTLGSDPDTDYVYNMARRFVGVSDMVCGDALGDTPKSMNCKYTVHYAGGVGYEVGTFSWQNDEWVITDGLEVWRGRR